MGLKGIDSYQALRTDKSFESSQLRKLIKIGVYRLTKTMKNTTSGGFFRHITARQNRFSYVFVVASLFAASPLAAVDGTWLGTTDADWAVVTNWSSGVAPKGTDTATFNGAGNGNVAVTVSTPTQPVLDIIFDTADAAAYTFPATNGRFRVRANGEIRMTDSVVNDQTFDCTVSLGVSNNPDTFFFLNDSTSAKLIFNGLIEGDTAGAVAVGTKNLNIGGAGDIDVNGVIENTAQGLASQRRVGLTKVGSGTLTLSNAANIYTGFTRVTEGTLALTSTGTLGDSLEVAVSAGALLSLDATNGHVVKVNSSIGGSGMATGGPVSVSDGGTLIPGDAGFVGTFTVDTLTMDANSAADFEVSGAGVSDLVEVTSADGFILNGGAISLFNEGTTDVASQAGTFDLFQFSGALGGAGVSALTVANPSSGFDYSFGVSGNTIQVTLTATGAFWDVDADGSWNTAGNWSNATVPNAIDAPASFGGGGTAITTARSVTVDGDKTVGLLAFDSAESFTLLSGTPDPSTITFETTINPPVLRVLDGTHTVGADLVIPVGFDLDVPFGGVVSLTGAISGDGGILLEDSGDVFLSGTNSYTGTTSVQDGILTIQGDHSLVGTDISVGLEAPTFAVLEVESGASVAVSAGNSVDVGSPGVVGGNGDRREFSLAGTMVNDGTLYIGRAGSVIVGSGGSWTQDGDLRLQVVGNVGNPSLTVAQGGTLNYTGLNTVKVNGPAPSGAAQGGNSVITISGDFLTGAGFEEGKTDVPNPGTGRGEVVLDGGTIQLTADVPDLVFADVGEIRLILQNDGTIDTDGFNSEVTIGITGSGNLVKEGAGTLTLTGPNTYGGDTIVSGGVLSVNGSSLPNAGLLDVSGGIVEIIADETVADLSYDGGALLPIGVYGSSSSAAPLANQDDTRFSGTGVLNVVGVITGGYAGWSTGNAGDQTPEEDFDQDGVQNGIEYFLNAAAGFTAAPGVEAGSVTWTNGGNIDSAQYGTEFMFQTSANLVDWDDVLIGDAALDNQAGSVSYALPTGVGPLFVRLVVDPS